MFCLSFLVFSRSDDFDINPFILFLTIFFVSVPLSSRLPTAFLLVLFYLKSTWCFERYFHSLGFKNTFEWFPRFSSLFVRHSNLWFVLYVSVIDFFFFCFLKESFNTEVGNNRWESLPSWHSGGGERLRYICIRYRATKVLEYYTSLQEKIVWNTGNGESRISDSGTCR